MKKSRFAREYLCAVCPPNQVWVTPGGLTANLAAAWGFPLKDRNSHTHHGRDAALIGVTDRRLLQQAAGHYAAQKQQGLNRLLSGLAEPMPHFKDRVVEAMEKMVVSHKVDHGIGGELHGATAYGILAPNGKPGNAQHRKPIAGFAKPDDMLAIKEVKLCGELLRDITGKPLADCFTFLGTMKELSKKKAKDEIKKFIGCDDKTFAALFLRVATAKGIRGIRIVEKHTLIPIQNKQGVAYKGLTSSSNAWYDVYENNQGRWVHDVVSTFDANTYATKNGGALLPPKGEKGRHVMRLFKNDMVELGEDGKKDYFYVLKFKTIGQIYLVPHKEANPNKLKRDTEDEFSLTSSMASGLQKQNAKAVFISPAGKVIYKERPCHVAERCRNKRE